VRVELGPAEPVEKALTTWRQDIAEERDSPAPTAPPGRGSISERKGKAARLDSIAAGELRRLLWDPLAGHVPTAPGSTVYLCPDGELSALPWAALPGRAKGSVLLQDHALALVPHGTFLLQRLREGDRPRPASPGVLLALGGVRYDLSPAAIGDPSTPPLPVRPADQSARQGDWPALTGTAREAAHIATLAKTLRQPPQVLQRRGTQAGAGQLLVDLPQTRWAHLATHGFFAAPQSGARKDLYDEKDFLRGMMGERVGIAARHPLTQTGLVLAGANLKGKDAGPDGGIVTAEALAGLDLHGLELAVLSACETGLGEAASGEGVFGLQRAFHLAGTRNVVASLWNVSDKATAALMARFYHGLWVEGKTPLEALRQAQLTIYRHPERIADLADLGRPLFQQTVALPADLGAVAGGQAFPAKRAPTRLWAAFVLSGVGQ
jgi:CHAT domain-containing protein